MLRNRRLVAKLLPGYRPQTGQPPPPLTWFQQFTFFLMVNLVVAGTLAFVYQVLSLLAGF